MRVSQEDMNLDTQVTAEDFTSADGAVNASAAEWEVRVDLAAIYSSIVSLTFCTKCWVFPSLLSDFAFSSACFFWLYS